MVDAVERQTTGYGLGLPLSHGAERIGTVDRPSVTYVEKQHCSAPLPHSLDALGRVDAEESESVAQEARDQDAQVRAAVADGRF